MRRVVLTVVCLWALPTILRAQTVRGIVVDASDRPVAGAVMMLLDGTSSVSARALTNERGEFQLTGPGAGTYRIRTTRIGFRPLLSDPMSLGAGETVTPRLTLTGIPFSLDTIHSEGKNACRMTARDSAAATWAVWEQVRAALTAGELTAISHGITATVVNYERTLETTHGRIVQQTATVRSDVVRQPWRSLSPDSLRRAGYVSNAGEMTTYSAPGLDVLLSDSFLEDHCFRLDTRDPKRLGVVFEPTSERKKVPEIRGTAWLDRKSTELRSLEFHYVNVSKDAERNAGGDMQFVHMTNGAWAISRWSIRMPVIEQVVVPGHSFDTRVAELHVIGGELVLATVATGRERDTLWSRPPLVLAGTVVDSTSGAPVQNAHVVLGGTASGSATDAAGRFSIVDVMPGNYVLQVRTASLDSVNAIKEAPLVFTDSMPALTIRVPTGSQIETKFCGTRSATLPGIVIGTASVRGDSTPRPNVEVTASWTDISIKSSGDVQRVTRVSDARTDSTGAFTICGVPVNTPLMVRAKADRISAVPVAGRIPAGQRFARADLTLEERVAAAAFSGVVQSDSTHTPIAHAEVSLPVVGKTVVTDATGAFSITDITPGPQQVRVRHLGYGVVDTLIEFVADETLRRRVYLARVTLLDSVLTTGTTTRDFGMESFEENRRMGLGKFFTREDIAKFEAGHTSDVLAQSGGVQIIPGHAGQAWIASSRGVRSIYVDSVTPVDRHNGARDGLCYAQVYLDNTLVYAPKPTGEYPPPLFDVNSISPASIEAIEYYAGAARIPAKYMRLDSPCGVLVIHTRR